MSKKYLQVAIQTPLRRCFDYLVGEKHTDIPLQEGMRVRVSFGHKITIGIIIAIKETTDVPMAKLKPIIDIIDEAPIIPPPLMSLYQWASRYYHHPIGDVIIGTLPGLLRKGQPATFAKTKIYTLKNTDLDLANFNKAPKQQKMLQFFIDKGLTLSQSEIVDAGFSTQQLKALIQKDLIDEDTQDNLPIQKYPTQQPAITLNDEQQLAIDSILKTPEKFTSFLLEGITGSGKTEVYLRCINAILEKGKQALVLVPEIGLTPQTIQRFRQRIDAPIALIHSRLNDRERLDAWLLAAKGIAKIIIGTRSAVFTPFVNLGLIIVDEAHDSSYKQQDGFRYSARDIAIKRAKSANVPIVLGSATHSLENIHNANIGRFHRLQLTKRAGVARAVDYTIVDIRNQSLTEGLSQPLIDEIKNIVEKREQAILFLNRRGYSPVLICHHCGWVAPCNRCDANMTLHLSPQHLHCHHCNATRGVDILCGNCEARALMPLGLGTERVEQALQSLFPHTGIIRIDRDAMRSKQSFDNALEEIHQQKYQILLGTQMLAKGHHFPNVTLVAILDADSGLYSSDFRAAERMAQLIIQVAGRAGREERPGKVLIQTHHPEHPLLNCLIKNGYQDFANATLQERQIALFPPFSHFALVRAESNQRAVPQNFLQETRKLLNSHPSQQGITILGPVPSPMNKKAGYFREQLLLQSKSRPELQKLIEQNIHALESLAQSQRVRWSIDVDPYDLF